jgi:hypothetical protein
MRTNLIAEVAEIYLNNIDGLFLRVFICPEIFCIHATAFLAMD